MTAAQLINTLIGGSIGLAIAVVGLLVQHYFAMRRIDERHQEEMARIDKENALWLADFDKRWSEANAKWKDALAKNEEADLRVRASLIGSGPAFCGMCNRPIDEGSLMNKPYRNTPDGQTIVMAVCVECFTSPDHPEWHQ